ncbi:hypothetical protein AAW14_03715, partial [Streptomyces hygroscopicus]|uniref:RICIN domain-containing protein n=1 Tax=Streptomyces hygroscopicus TaxID=1912 RepID=UPI002240D155
GAAHRARRRPAHRRQLALAAAAVGALALVPLAVWSGTRSGGSTMTGAGKAPGEPTPGTTNGFGTPSWIGAAADVPTGAFEGRLRNHDSGLCIGLNAKTAVVGTEAVLVPCTSSVTQQWAYRADGLLRSVAAPGLCLDSHLGYSVQLAACAGRSTSGTKDVRYDFTRQGAFVPRSNRDLALTPASSAPNAGLVLKPRTEDDTQRWAADTSNAVRMQTVNWGAEAEPTASPSRSTRRSPAARTTPRPAPAPSGPARATGRPSSPAPGTCPYCTPGGRGGGSAGRGGYGGWGDGGYGGRGPYGAQGGGR